jgi:hypothetical protein
MKFVTRQQEEALVEAYDDFWVFLISHSITDIANDGNLIVEYSRKMERLDHCFKRVFGGVKRNVGKEE